MTVLFAGGDVGGARALLPVIQVCADTGLSFVLLAHGHLLQEAPASWPRVYFCCDNNGEAVQDFLQRHNIDQCVFASSVHDTLPLSIARGARQLGMPVMHVLDNWTAYRRRLEMDGLPALVPDVYTVMDEYARQAAIRDGVEASVLQVTGQPALATLADECRTRSTDELWQKRQRLGFAQQNILIAFISEPVAQDQGASPTAPHYRGYTEKDVLQLFCRHLQPLADRVEITLLPHPRQNRDALSELWRHYRGALRGGVSTGISGREAVCLVDGVAGMASILLYAAWLLGKPVLSLQPGLRQAALRMLQTRQGVVFIETYEGAAQAIGHWGEALRPGRTYAPHSDLALHRTAAEKIMNLLVEGKGQPDECGNHSSPQRQ
jgi:hypothetical protein